MMSLKNLVILLIEGTTFSFRKNFLVTEGEPFRTENGSLVDESRRGKACTYIHVLWLLDFSCI